jgi:protein-S-isoprenylcysteine O-methyltransferase Ste14
VPAPFLYAGFLLAAILLHWAVPLPAPFPAVTGGLGWVAVLAGLLLGLLALQRMRHAHTPVSPHRPATALVTDGPYRFTRNPIYLGFLLVFLGFTGLAGTLWGALLSPLVPMTVNWLVIDAEEAHLQARFTDRYARYKSRVPKWI